MDSIGHDRKRIEKKLPCPRLNVKRNERNSATIQSLEHAGNRQKPSERDRISSTKQLTKRQGF